METPRIYRKLQNSVKWKCIVAYSITRFIIDGLLLANTLLIHAIIARFRTNLVFGLMPALLPNAVIFFSGPFAAEIISRMGCRFTAIAGVLLSFSGILISLAAKSIFSFSFLYGLVGGVGIGLLHYSMDAALGLYAGKSIAVTNDIGLLFSVVGCVAIPSIVEWSLHEYQFESLLLIGACIIFHGMIAAVLIGRPYVPNRYLRTTFVTSQALTNPIWFENSNCSSDSAIKMRLMRFEEFVFAFGFYAYLLMIPGLSSLTKAQIFPGISDVLVYLSVLAIGKTVSRIIIDWLLTEFQLNPVYTQSSLQLLICLESIVVVNASNCELNVLIHSLLYGFLYGTNLVCMAALTNDLVDDGESMCDEIYCYLGFRGLGAFAGCVGFGLLMQFTGNYGLLYTLSGICCAISSFVGLTVWGA